MKSLKIYANKQDLAEAIALQTIEFLRKTIYSKGVATWVIAGGTTPEAAYSIIAARYLDGVDWSKVNIIIGDERIAPLDSSDSNWHQAEKLLLQYIPQATLLRPISDQPAEIAANQYNVTLNSLSVLDLVWLGMGEDGHTLSLFPDHDNSGYADELVVPVYNSPKPPSNRITLSLAALRNVSKCMILVAGTGKAEAFAQANTTKSSLPVAVAVRTISDNGGTVEWLVDKTVASTLPN